MNCFSETTASARLWLYVKRLYFISSALAYCISPYASFYAGLSCFYCGNNVKKTRLGKDGPNFTSGKCRNCKWWTEFRGVGKAEPTVCGPDDFCENDRIITNRKIKLIRLFLRSCFSTPELSSLSVQIARQ